MKPFVIVIGRQFGCGGHEIGKRIAAALDVPYYDKTLLSEAAREFGLDSELFSAVDERRPSFFRNFLGMNVGTADSASTPGALTGESLYNAQSEVIRSICKKGSCVIVGRTADYLMREHPGLLSIFIQAPIDYRVKKIIERKDASCEQEALDLARRHDRGRQSYYNYYTNREWGTAGNYHLCFDSSKFDTEAIIRLLKAHLESKE